MVQLAGRAHAPVSSIRKIFQQLPTVKKQREQHGWTPLIDLSIGQPHIAPHPAVMQTADELAKLSADKSHYPELSL